MYVFTFCEDFASRDIKLEKNVNYVLAGLRRAGKTTLLYQRVQNTIKDFLSILGINSTNLPKTQKKKTHNTSGCK